MLKRTKLLALPCLLSLLATSGAVAQVSKADEGNNGSVYIFIGSNSPTFGASDIKIEQGSGGNVSSYTLNKVAGDNNTTLSKGLSNNIRVGYFFDYNQTFAIELAYDPVKYHVTDGQSVRLSGTMDNKPIDTAFAFAAANGYYYNLDGANLLSLNLVRRFQLIQDKRHFVRLDALAKAGGGVLMPHITNSVAGKPSEYPSFQLAGWNAGIEAALRVTLFRYVFVEAGYRYTYASYTDVGVYNGTATQKLGVSQVLFGGGITFPTTKHNPLFVKPDNSKPPLTIRPIYPDPIDEEGEPEPGPGALPTAMPEPDSPAPDSPAPPDEVPQEEPAPAPAPEDPGPGQ